MNEPTLTEILEKICDDEVSEYENLKPSHHLFTTRHQKAMEEILYPHHCSEEISDKRRKIPIHKKFLIMTIVIIMAVMSITAGGAMLRGFNRKVYPEYTVLLPVDAENCPKTIENVYYLPEIPEKYKLYQEHYDSNFVTIFYKNVETKRNMTFSQKVKFGYRDHFNTEHQDFQELEINGNYALFIDFSNSEQSNGIIVWDNGDYILYLAGDFTKDELIKMAESVRLKDTEGGINNDRNNT